MVSTTMRAKFRVANVEANPTSERITFSAVGKSMGYSSDGLDEDSTFSKFTPQADLTMTITNPALLGRFSTGQTYYADFTPAIPSASGKTYRQRALELARQAVIPHRRDNDYIPENPDTFQPHEWVLEAIIMALKES